MKAQVYVKSYNGITSLVVADETNMYYAHTDKWSEMTAIKRGCSYVKNMYSYACESLEIFSGQKPEDIFNDEYLKHLHLPIMIGTELSVDKGLENVCNNNLNVELRFRQISRMEKEYDR